jgi:hypothetical protein
MVFDERSRRTCVLPFASSHGVFLSGLWTFHALVQDSDVFTDLVRFAAVVFVLLAHKSWETGHAALFDPVKDVLTDRIQRLPCCLKSGGVNLFEPGSFAFQRGQLFVLALPGWRYPRLIVLPNALV